MPTPSVGRIVHYVSYGTPGGEYTSQCRAAKVAEVGAWMFVAGSESDEVVHDDGIRYRTIEQRWEDDACALVVENPTGLFFNTCSYHEGDIGHDHTGVEIPSRSYRGGTWHWPERVGE